MIYLLAYGTTIEAHKSLRNLVKLYPNIPYYSFYRKLKKGEEVTKEGCTIRKITLYS